MPTKLSGASSSPPIGMRFRALLWLGVCLLAACEDLDPTAVDGQLGEEKKQPVPTTPTTLPPTTAPGANPFAGSSLYAEPGHNALTTAEQWRSTRPDDAALLERIGKTPQAVWFNGWQSDVASAAASYVSAAANAGSLPVLVAYNIPQRDCGSYAAGGSSSAEAYLAWIRDFARGIGARRAVVVLEPDALAGMNCLSAADRERRVGLLREAVNILKANAGTSVYLDGGHPKWLSAAEMANRLISANVAAANGFALNVSNFIWNSDNVAYGQAISSLLGGKHFVIDTSRNGQGPNTINEWCNPSGRGLGVAPTTATGHALVDALLWVKRPGESDGLCNGGPASGKWWAEYALGLAQRATQQVALN